MSCEEDLYCDCCPREKECDCTEERICTSCSRPVCVASRRTFAPDCTETCECNCACLCKSARPRKHYGQCQLWNTNCPPRTTPSMECKFKSLVRKWSRESRQQTGDECCACTQPSTCNCNCSDDTSEYCTPRPKRSCSTLKGKPPCLRVKKTQCPGSQEVCAQKSGTRTIDLRIPLDDDTSTNNQSCSDSSGQKLWKGLTLKFRIGSKGVVGSPEVTIKENTKDEQRYIDLENGSAETQCTGDVGCWNEDEADDSAGEEIFYVRRVTNPKKKLLKPCYCDGNTRRVSIDEQGISNFRTDSANNEQPIQDLQYENVDMEPSGTLYGTESIYPYYNEGTYATNNTMDRPRSQDARASNKSSKQSQAQEAAGRSTPCASTRSCRAQSDFTRQPQAASTIGSYHSENTKSSRNTSKFTQPSQAFATNGSSYYSNNTKSSRPPSPFTRQSTSPITEQVYNGDTISSMAPSQFARYSTSPSIQPEYNGNTRSSMAPSQFTWHSSPNKQAEYNENTRSSMAPSQFTQHSTSPNMEQQYNGNIRSSMAQGQFTRHSTSPNIEPEYNENIRSSIAPSHMSQHSTSPNIDAEYNENTRSSMALSQFTRHSTSPNIDAEYNENTRSSMAPSQFTRHSTSPNIEPEYNENTRSSNAPSNVSRHSLASAGGTSQRCAGTRTMTPKHSHVTLPDSEHVSNRRASSVSRKSGSKN